MSEVSIQNLKNKLNNKIEKYVNIEGNDNGKEYFDDSRLDIEERIKKLERIFDLKEEYKKIIEMKNEQEEEIIKDIDELRNKMNKIHENTKNQISNYANNYNKLIEERIKLERIRCNEKLKVNPRKKNTIEGMYLDFIEEWEEKKIRKISVPKEEKPKEEKPKEERIGRMIEKGNCGNNVKYELYENGKMFIDGFGDMKNCEWNNGTLNTPWYSKRENIKEIVIENGVSSIGNRCFAHCSNLSTINIPSTVSSIGGDCFSDCAFLSVINIPSSVSSLGNYCFEYCSNLSTINIPSSVTSIGEGCFWQCSSLSTINIPSSVTFIGRSCFYLCYKLKGNIQININNRRFRTDGTKIYRKDNNEEVRVW